MNLIKSLSLSFLYMVIVVSSARASDALTTTISTLYENQSSENYKALYSAYTIDNNPHSELLKELISLKTTLLSDTGKLPKELHSVSTNNTVPNSYKDHLIRLSFSNKATQQLLLSHPSYFSDLPSITNKSLLQAYINFELQGIIIPEHLLPLLSTADLTTYLKCRDTVRNIVISTNALTDLLAQLQAVSIKYYRTNPAITLTFVAFIKWHYGAKGLLLETQKEVNDNVITSLLYYEGLARYYLYVSPYTS